MIKELNRNNVLNLLLLLFILVFCVKIALGNGDFKVFLEAAKIVREGGSPYNKWLHVGGNGYCLYFYSPLWAIVLIPFTYLNNFIPNIAWLIANIFFLYRTVFLLRRYLSIEKLTSKQIKIILFLTILMSIRFILYNFGMIQMTLFILWSVLEGLRLFKNDKWVLGGLIIAFAINVKILPIVILPYLIYRKEFRAFISISIFSVLLLIIPSIYLGWDGNSFLLSEWWSVINPANSEHLIESDLGPHSLTALIPSLLTETQGDIDIKRNILSLNVDAAIRVLNIIRILLVLFTFYFLKWPPFRKNKSNLLQLYELAYLFLIIPLIFPHMQKYAFALVIPLYFYISHFLVYNFKYRNIVIRNIRWYAILILYGLSFVLMTLSTDGIIGRELNEITQHFKTITWGSILLIFVLILAPPKITLKTKKILIEKMRLKVKKNG